MTPTTESTDRKSAIKSSGLASGGNRRINGHQRKKASEKGINASSLNGREKNLADVPISASARARVKSSEHLISHLAT